MTKKGDLKAFVVPSGKNFRNHGFKNFEKEYKEHSNKYSIELAFCTAARKFRHS